MLREMTLLVALLGLGCRGEEVVAVDASTDGATVDGAADAAADVGADAPDAACSIPGNLLQNGSFEIAYSGAFPGWPNPTLDVTQRTSGGDDCAGWAEVASSTSFWTFQQVVSIDEIPAGVVIEFGASLRAIGGEVKAADVFVLEAGDVEGNLAPYKTLNADGSWLRVAGVHTLKRPAKSLTFGINSNVAAPRTLGVDRAYVAARR